jgi:hypothetical protein
MSYKVAFSSLRIGDIVRTPLGALAIVTERSWSTSPARPSLRLAFPGGVFGEKNCWWEEHDGLQLVCRWGGVKAFCGIRAGKRKPRP